MDLFWASNKAMKVTAQRDPDTWWVSPSGLSVWAFEAEVPSSAMSPTGCPLNIPSSGTQGFSPLCFCLCCLCQPGVPTSHFPILCFPNALLSQGSIQVLTPPHKFSPAPRKRPHPLWVPAALTFYSFHFFVFIQWFLCIIWPFPPFCCGRCQNRDKSGALDPMGTHYWLKKWELP